MKKLFLLLAAFTCNATYTRDPQASDLIIGLGILIGSTYLYNNYCKTPASNELQQTNTSDSNNIPHTNAPATHSTTNPNPNDGDYALRLDISHRETNGEKINKFSVELALPEDVDIKEIIHNKEKDLLRKLFMSETHLHILRGY